MRNTPENKNFYEEAVGPQRSAWSQVVPTVNQNERQFCEIEAFKNIGGIRGLNPIKCQAHKKNH